MKVKKHLLKGMTRRLLALGLAATLGLSGAVPSGGIPVQAETSSTYASKNNADPAGVTAATLAALQGVEYSSLASLVARSYYSAAERLNKQTELIKSGIAPADITEAMIVEALNVDDLKVMSFGDAYARVQEDLDTLIPLIVQNSEAWADGDETAYFTQTITENKEKILVGLTYLYRLYDFNIGDVNIKDKIFEDVDYFGADYDQLWWLIDLGSAGGDALKLSNNVSVFNNHFAYQMTNSTSLTAFLENEIAKNNGMTPDQWFKDESNALIAEKQSATLGGTVNLYTRLKNQYPSYLLPILNVSENSIYAVSTPGAITLGLVDAYVNRSNKGTAAYETELATFKADLEKHADLQTRYLELWNRIAKEDDRSELISDRIVLDGMRIKGQSAFGSASQEWSPKVGDTVSLGVEEFFAPMNLYTTYTAADAQADTSSGMITFWMAKAIGEKGLSTYSHELTHLLVNSVWLNDYNSRQGLEGEFFTRGLFETYYETYFDPQMSLNMILDLSNDSSRIYNATPERFQTPEDLQEFTQGMMDVLYTLDYMEAQAILGKTAAEKQKWFHQLNQKEATRKDNQGNANAKHTNDNIVTIDEALAASLLTVEDLVDNNIVTSRYPAQYGMTTGELLSEEYHAVPMFSAGYATAQNDNGATGALTARRQAFDLLAEYGYYEGMVPYISNQYLAEAEAQGGVLSDTYIFGKIFGSQYADAKAFKKAMFARRAEKLEELKPISITVNGTTTQITSADQLQEMMNAAVVADLPNMPYQYSSAAPNAQVEKLKAAVYTAYLQETDDFTTSIYLDEVPTPEPTPEEDPEIDDEYMQISVSGTFDISGTENYANASGETIKDAIFDDVSTTWWNSTKVSAVEKGNPYLMIDLSADYNLSKIEYTPRWNSTAKWGCTGNISTLIVEVSADGQTWTDVTNGGKTVDLATTDANAYPLEILFDADEVRYVRISGTTSYHWGSEPNTSITIGDLSIYGVQLPLSGDKTSVTVSGTTQTTPNNENNVGSVTLDNINDNLFDDDTANTFWNSNKLTSGTITKGNPYLIVELNGTYDLKSIGYTPRWNNGAKWECTGNIKKLNLEVSANGTDWTTITQDGGDVISLAETAQFPYMVNYEADGVRYVRISGNESHHWQDSNKNTSITISELDIYGFELPEEEVDDGTWLKAGTLPATDETVTQNQPFAAGTADSNIFRIPCLITLENGNLLAVADARYVEYRDFGGIDTLASVSIDNGVTWKYSFPIWYPDSDGSAGTSTSAATQGIATTAIDPVIVQGPDGTIYCLADMNPSGITTQDRWPGQGTGYVTIDGVERLALTSNYSNASTQPTDSDTTTYEYYVGDFDENGFAPVLNRRDNSASDYGVDEWYNIYSVVNGQYVANLKQTQVDSDAKLQQNAFYKDSVLHVYNTGYIFMVTSTDGMNWENPQILNPQIKRDNETALLVSPGRGMVTSEGDIVIGCYNAFQGGTESASVFYLKNGSTTWQRTSGDVQNVAKSSENEVVELYDGTLRMFYRSDTMKMCYADITKDASGNYVMGAGQELSISISSNCNISAIRLEQTTIGGKPVVLTAVPEGPGSWNRVKGRIYVFTINEDNSMNHVSTYAVNEDAFAYSCLTELANGDIGILWEPGNNAAAAIRYDVIAIEDILPLTEKDVTVKIGESYRETLGAGADTAVSGNPNAAVANVAVQAVQGKVVQLYDKGATTPNTSLKLSDAELTFSSVDAANNQWTVKTNKNLYMVNRQPGGSGTATYLFQTEEGSMTVTPDGTGAFTFKDTTSNRYTIFYSKSDNLNFNAMGSQQSGEYYQYNLMLLEKQAGVSADDTLPGYKQVSTITDGKSYLVAYSYNSSVYVMFPSTGASPWNAVTKTAVVTDGTITQLVITGVKKGTTQATVNGINYNITVVNAGEIEITLEVGQTYTVADGLIDEQPAVSGVVEAVENVSYAQSSATTFETGKKYVITTYDGYILKNAEKPSYNTWAEGLTLASNDYSETWVVNVKEVVDVSNGVYKVSIRDAEGKFICFEEPTNGNTAVNMKTEEQILTLTRKSEGVYSISYTGDSNTSYLDDLGQAHSQAAGWASGSSANACGWKFFKMDASTVITAQSVGETTMSIDGTTYRFTVIPKEEAVPGLKDIVVDFGLPVTVHIEPWQDESETVNLQAGRAVGQASCGTADVAGDTTNGWDITYTPTAILTAADTVTLASSDGAKQYSFKVYPANSVYYEEGFMTETEGNWSVEGYEQKAPQQAAGFGDSQKDGGSNYGYDAVYENQLLTQTVQVVADSSIRPISECQYTFVETGTTATLESGSHKVYTISAVNDNGTTVYLNSGTSNNKAPNQLTSTGVAIIDRGNGSFSFVTVNASAVSQGYLHCTAGTPELDRCSSHSSHAAHNFEVYQWTGNTDESAVIRGCEKVSELNEIRNGGKYLIVYNNNGTRFVLNPASGTAAGDFTNSGKAKHIARLSTTATVGTEYTTTNADTNGVFDQTLANAELTFAFTGTGVDIYANCSADSGLAMVLLSKVNDGGSTKIEKVLMADTKLSAGSDLTDFGKIQNVPFVSLPAGTLEYGKYQVAVVHATSKQETGEIDDKGNSLRENVATSLSIDGFRVYGTLNRTDDVAYYAVDKEAGMIYQEVRDTLLAAWSVESDEVYAEQLADTTMSQIYSAIEDNQLTGAMLLDSSSQELKYTNDALIEYLNNNSKNEVYLYPGQSLVFSLTKDNVNPQIALKSLSGSVNYTLTAAGETKADNVQMNANTEMYYPLSMKADADSTSFTITNSGNVGVLAVTKLKTSNPTGAVTYGIVTPKDVAMALISLGFESENPIQSDNEDVTTVFDDVSEDWYTDYVQYVYDNKLMVGAKGTGRFAPNNNITKAQVAQVLYNMEGKPAVIGGKVFDELTDVYDAEWYADAVAWAYNEEIITGNLSTKQFNPNADVTREQLTLMMFRYAKYRGFDTSASSNFEGLAGSEQVAIWSMDGMKWAVGAGLISGVQKDDVKYLAPRGNATRAQVAAILQRFCEVYEIHAE